MEEIADTGHAAPQNPLSMLQALHKQPESNIKHKVRSALERGEILTPMDAF